jgi:YidC/Oxa1 family membrane protein insertase
MTTKDPKQMAMVYIMPIVFFFIFMSFPAGLVLYWTTFNILSIITQYFYEKKYWAQEG